MGKSPTRRLRRQDSPFSKEEEVWIVKNAMVDGKWQRSGTALRQLFIVRFNISNHASVPKPWTFTRLISRFDATGGVTGQHIGKLPFVSTPENIKWVERFFTENPTSSLTIASRDLDISHTSLWFILRRKLNWKPHRYKRVHRLTPQNEAARSDFCRWILSQPIGFEQKIIFSDETMFVMHPSPNRQNDRIWAPWDPDELAVCRYQGDSKIMCWAALVDDSILTLRWMDDVDHAKRVTSDSYHAMIRDFVWPEVRGRAAARRGWWMQDGAPAHVSNTCIEFLEDKFRGRVITRWGENPWPAYSPDLNVLYFYFWGFANQEVWRRKPSTIAELREIVEDVARNLSGDIIRAVMANFRKRCEVCLEMGGSYFEYALERFE